MNIELRLPLLGRKIYFESTGDDRKDAGLRRAMEQIFIEVFKQYKHSGPFGPFGVDVFKLHDNEINDIEDHYDALSKVLCDGYAWRG